MSINKPKPQVIPLPNGPLYYFTDFTPHPVAGLSGDQGQTYSHPSGVALCRCGESAGKPFCDGSHGAIHFNERKESDGHMDRRKSYQGQKIVIHDNRHICSHAGYCVNELPGVFDRCARPWVNPDGAEVAAIIAVIEKCPSGALSYSIEGVEHRDLEREPTVIVTQDGPYCLVGGVEVVGHEPRAQEVSQEHCTLCRCGSSRNKPFCDGNHAEIGFKDPV